MPSSKNKDKCPSTDKFKQRFSCTVCKRKFTRKDSLQSHSSIHSGIYNYICVFCDKQFNTRNLLNRHLRCHTGEKPYWCKLCDMTFAENGQLTKHTQQVHLNLRPFTCEKCSFSYTTKQNLTRHIKNGHESSVHLKKVDNQNRNEESVFKQKKFSRPQKSPRVVISIEDVASGKKEVFYEEQADSDEEDASWFGNKKYMEYRVDVIRPISSSKPSSKHRVPCSFLLDLPVQEAAVVSLMGINLDFSSILPVITNEAIDNRVIHLYFKHMFQKYDAGKMDVTSPQIHYELLPLFYFSIQNDKDNSDPQTCSRRRFRQIVQKFVVQPNSVLVAPQFARKHFFLAVIDIANKTAHVLDSAWGYISDTDRKNQIKCVLKHLMLDNKQLKQNWKQYEIIEERNCAQQEDDTSCGIFMIQFANEILKNNDVESASMCKVTLESVKSLRENVVSVLLNTTPNGKKILKALSD